MKAFEKLCWVIALVMTAVAALRLIVLSLATGASAPQYAAEAAGICAMAIIPYVFARAIQGFSSERLKDH